MLVRHSVLAQAIPVDANSPMRGQCILYLQGNPGFATFPVTALRPSRRHIRCATKKRLEEYGADRIWPCRPYLIPQARTSGPRPRNAIRLFLGWGSEYDSSSCGANMSIKMFVVGCRGIPLVNTAPSVSLQAQPGFTYSFNMRLRDYQFPRDAPKRDLSVRAKCVPRTLLARELAS
jgi:hypothetical protein